MNSALNPEAPEFHPYITTVTQKSYPIVGKATRASNVLPAGTSYEQFKTYTNFNIVQSHMNEHVISQSNQIITTELPAVRLKNNECERNMEKVVDTNDSMLDRVNISIDDVGEVNKSSDKFLEGIKPGVQVSSWNKHNNAPVIAKIQVGSTTFIGAKNIPRPQLAFKDTIDNSESLWVPKISDKPNNIKPLSLNILYNEEGTAVGYEHPYAVEIDLYHPQSEFIDPDPSPPAFPPPLKDTKLTFVDTEKSLDELVEHLRHVKEMAVDVEHHSYRTYQGITCLIQITTNEGGDFIIDALAIREHIHKLNVVFTDPKKIKVFHGAEMDVLWLQRDFGVYIVGLFDTHRAAKGLNLSRLSLKFLLFKYCQVNVDKKYQLADWRMRPLPDELTEYARMDTHYLLYIWRQMKRELLDAGAGQQHLLLAVFEQSRQICGSTYSKERIHAESHMPLYMRSNKSFTSRQMAALQLLFKWRDAQARVLDESTMYLLPNHMLLSLAESLPRELQGVTACCNPMPPFVKQNLVTIHRMLLSCREMPLEPQLYQMPCSIRNMVNSSHQPLAAYSFHDLSHFPDFREDQCINLDQNAVFIENFQDFQADITVFNTTYEDDSLSPIVSSLNVDAKLFIPPYDRYRKYRSLAQMEEIKEFKEKEAKIAAISKGNELIKKEVIKKIHEVKQLIETESAGDAKNTNNKDEDNESVKNSAKRKRKMSNEKLEPLVSVITDKSNSAPKNHSFNSKPDNNKHINKKKLLYKNVDYKKFFEADRPNKEPKTKFKKCK